MNMLSGRSRTLSLIFVINIIQYLAILAFPADNVNWYFVHSVAIPLLFVSYHATKYDRVAWTILVYWYIIQVLGYRIDDGPSFAMEFGFYFNLTFRYGDAAILLNPLALILLLFVVLEVDKVYVGQNEPPTSVT